MKNLVKLTLFVICCLSSFALDFKILKNVSALIIVEVEINNQKLKMLLDSGSNANFIDPKAYKKLSSSLVRNKKLDTMVNTFSGKRKSQGYDWSFKIGEFNFKNLPTYIMNTSKFSKRQDGIECCDGILGIDFIKNFPLEVNIEKQYVRMTKKFTLKGDWKRLPIKLEGKNVVTFRCSTDNNNFKFRLDSGNEIPVVFHRHATDKYLLREQVFYQGYSGEGLALFTMPELRCGGLKASGLVSTFFYGTSGALSHKFVDGNVGSHILGKNYIFDLKNKAIWTRGDSLNLKVGRHSFFFFDQFDFNKGDPSVVHQAQALIINSCTDAYNFQDCLKKLCHLENKKICVFKETGKVFNDFITYRFPVRTNDCSIYKLTGELRSKPVQYNFCWYKLSILNQLNTKKKLVRNTFSPKGDLKKYSKDVKIIEIADPYEFTKNYYCHAVFNRIIKKSALPASLFGLSVKGMSYSSRKLKDYKKWLSTKEGKSCLKDLKSQTGGAPDKNFYKLDFHKSKYVVLINPFTLLGDGLKNWSKNYDKTINHEVLHAVYDMDKSLKSKVKKKWEALSQKSKNAFKKGHPSYNFSNPNILLREFFAYSYEEKLGELKKLR